MNSLSRTEFRTLSERRAQADLERRIRKHHDAIAAREARFRKLPTPQQPEPVNFCAPDDAKPESFGWIDSAVFLTPMFVVAALILIARWSGWLA